MIKYGDFHKMLFCGECGKNSNYNAEYLEIDFRNYYCKHCGSKLNDNKIIKIGRFVYGRKLYNPMSWIFPIKRIEFRKEK